MFNDMLAGLVGVCPRGACACGGGPLPAGPSLPGCPAASARAALGRFLAACALVLGGLGEVPGFHGEQGLRMDVATQRSIDRLRSGRADALLELRIPHEVP